MSDTALSEIVHESISVQDNGIRIPSCPECGQPVMIEYGLSTGKFGACPWEDCNAWLAHAVKVTTEAYETHEQAEEAHADAK